MTLEEKEYVLSTIVSMMDLIQALTIVEYPSKEYVPHLKNLNARLLGSQAMIQNNGTKESKLGCLQSVNHLLYVKREAYMRDLNTRTHNIMDVVGAMEKLIDAAQMDDKDKEEIIDLSHTIKQRLCAIQNFSSMQLKVNDKDVMDMIMTLFVGKEENNGEDGSDSKSTGGGDTTEPAPPTDAGVFQQDE